MQEILFKQKLAVAATKENKRTVKEITRKSFIEKSNQRKYSKRTCEKDRWIKINIYKKGWRERKALWCSY